MKSREPMTINDRRHGTTTGYANGCRDRCCRDAMTAARRRLRSRRVRAGKPAG